MKPFPTFYSPAFTALLCAFTFALVGCAPTVSIVTPVDNATVTGVIPVGASITDDGGNTGLTARLLVDDHDVGPLVVTGYGWLYARSPGVLGLDTASLTVGAHTLQVRATDSGNLAGESAVVHITTVPPRKEGERMGINVWAEPTGSGQELDVVRSFGFGWYRIAWEWSWIEGTQGHANYADYDRIVGWAHARGLKVLAVALGTPAWASAGGVGGKYPPTAAHLADFCNYATTLGQHGADAIEIWNEPNNPNTFWQPHPDVAGFARMQIACYRAIKAALPNTPVITGGLSPYGDMNNTSDPQINLAPPNYFAAAMAISGFAQSFDGVGHHPYCFPNDPLTSPISWNGFQQTRSLHDILVAHGRGDVPIWFTEFGATSGPSGDPAALSEAGMGAQFTKYFTGIDQFRADGIHLGPMFVYTMYDGAPGTGSPWEAYMGLLHANGTDKPPAPVVRAYAARAQLVP